MRSEFEGPKCSSCGCRIKCPKCGDKIVWYMKCSDGLGGSCYDCGTRYGYETATNTIHTADGTTYSV